MESASDGTSVQPVSAGAGAPKRSRGMEWGAARELARVPGMDRAGALAYLWGDDNSFAVLWVPEGQVIARAVKPRDNPKRLEAYRKTLERWRRAGEPIVACYEVESEDLPLSRLVSLIESGQISWGEFAVWKYYGIGGNGGDDLNCKFEMQARLPETSPQTAKIFRALKATLTPAAWQQILPLLPGDPEATLRKGTPFRAFWLPLIGFLLTVAFLVTLSRCVGQGLA